MAASTAPQPSLSAQAHSALAHAGPRQEEDPGGLSGVCRPRPDPTPCRPAVGHLATASCRVWMGDGACPVPRLVGSEPAYHRPSSDLRLGLRIIWDPRGLIPPRGSDQIAKCEQRQALGDHRRAGRGRLHESGAERSFLQDGRRGAHAAFTGKEREGALAAARWEDRGRGECGGDSRSFCRVTWRPCLLRPCQSSHKSWHLGTRASRGQGTAWGRQGTLGIHVARTVTKLSSALGDSLQPQQGWTQTPLR